MGKIVEHFEATVSSNDDPEKRGRIRVTCPGIMGDDEEELANWIEPVPMWGWFIVPDVDEIVEIEVVTSSTTDEQFGQASIANPDYKWRSSKRFWGNEEAEEGSGKTSIPEDFTASNYGKRRGFSTPGGHVLLFDDTEGDRKITLTWKKEGSESRTSISIDKHGSFVMNTHASHLIHANAKDGSLSVIDGNGNHMLLKDEKVSLMNSAACCIEMDGQNVQVLAQGACTVSGKNITLDAGQIDLGKVPTDFALMATLFLAAFDTHTHPIPPTPQPPTITSVPSVPLSPNAALKSTTVKVQP